MRRGQSNPMKGHPRAPQWTAGEIARLDAILHRAADGRETARKGELVALAKATGRTIKACRTMLHKRRRGVR